MQHKPHLPFPALVGLEHVQQALLLLAIDPRLRGVVLAAPAGTGKTSLARGLRDLLGAKIPFVELPSSIDTENLLGGADVEATLRTGKLVMHEGVLSRAHGGFVYADGINLLPDNIINVLLSVMDTGIVTIERDGLSMTLPADFSLIATYDPAEGAPRQHLLDRVGLIVPLWGQQTAEQRQRVVRHNLKRHSWRDESDFLRGILHAAQAQVAQVVISDDQIEQLAGLALRYGVQGHRAEIFASYAACAAAAYDLRPEVEFADLELAFKVVILPRATHLPEKQQPPPPENHPQEEPHEADDENSDRQPEEIVPLTDQVFEALLTDLPDVLQNLPFTQLRRGRSGSRGATSGKRGRHIRSVPGNPRQHRLDVIATLRAAAPWQRLRQQATPDQARILLEAGDIRVKQYRSKAGTLFCVAVDASGSMAIHRMRQAKGAVQALLEQAYVQRDKVALIAFRGKQAELLMPPSQSVELARRALDVLPTGGGTPLTSALLLACDVAQQAKLRGILQTILVLLTDGRGNITFVPNADPQAELQQVGRYVQTSGLRVLVIDTQRNYLSRGEARQLAQCLGGEYMYLPNASGEHIAHTAAALRDT